MPPLKHGTPGGIVVDDTTARLLLGYYARKELFIPMILLLLIVYAFRQKAPCQLLTRKCPPLYSRSACTQPAQTVLHNTAADMQHVIFKASALWADAFYKSKCPYVCLFVCVFVCLFTFEVPFNGLFAPTSRSRMSNIF